VLKRAIVVSLFGAIAAPATWAQSSVTLYGSLDAGVAYISNAGGSAKYMEEQGNMQPDRWGLKGSENLGGGLHALFLLENGFYTNTGGFAKSGTEFNRSAYVGIEDDKIGKITLGQQTPFAFDYLGPLSTAYQAQSWFFFHPGNIDELADTGVVPYSNSVKFRSANFGGFDFGVMMGLGNTTDFAYGKTLSVAASYGAGPFRASAVYAVEHNRTISIATTGISTFQGQAAATYTADKVENMGAGASYRLGKLFMHALWTRVTIENFGYEDIYQSFDAGANYQMTAANQIAGGASTTTLSGRRWSSVEIGDNYSLSKATQIYVNVMYEHANDKANAAFFTAGVSGGRNQTIVLAGVHHSF
jgi:predicted porin